MNAPSSHPRSEDEWRVSVNLDAEDDGYTFAERLHTHNLDDEARERLGSDVVVTRDGPKLFLYAWHEQSAREAERVVRELLEADGLAAEVELTRWHPDADEWRPASEPLPSTPEEAAAERERHQAEAAKEAEASGEYDWQVVIHMPDAGGAGALAEKLSGRGLPVKRRWRYLMVGAATEEQGIELGKQLEGEVPEDATVGLRADPNKVSMPGFIWLGL
jgi:hypothetical protein